MCCWDLLLLIIFKFVSEVLFGLFLRSMILNDMLLDVDNDELKVMFDGVLLLLRMIINKIFYEWNERVGLLVVSLISNKFELILLRF